MGYKIALTRTARCPMARYSKSFLDSYSQGSRHPQKQQPRSPQQGVGCNPQDTESQRMCCRWTGRTIVISGDGTLEQGCTNRRGIRGSFDPDGKAWNESDWETVNGDGKDVVEPGSECALSRRKAMYTRRGKYADGGYPHESDASEHVVFNGPSYLIDLRSPWHAYISLE